MTAAPRFAHGAIVLAGGASRRLGQPKQLVERDGETLVHRAARLARTTSPGETIVVVGHDAPAVASAVADLDVRVVACDDWAEGMAASLRAGIAALDARATHALVLLVDQLALDATHLARLVDAARAAPSRIAASAFAGTTGVPAIFPRAWFARLAALRGDTGARALLRDGDDGVTRVVNDALRDDLDTPADAP